MEGGTPLGVRKGAWTEQEDVLLKNYVDKYGEGKWHQVPSRAGLNRCRKSCRLRWLNYLRPNIKRGEFTFDEVDLIIRLHKLLGNRWSLIAGRLPGRTANDVKNYWNTHLLKKMASQQHDKVKYKPQGISVQSTKIIKPQPRTFSKNSLLWQRGKCSMVKFAHNNDIVQLQDNNKIIKSSPPPLVLPQEDNAFDSWWVSLLVENNKTVTSSLSWSEDEPIIASTSADQEVPIGERTKEGLGRDCDVEGQSGRNCESSFDMDLWSLLDLENEMLV